VLLIALRDLQFRLRRFLISVVAVALVLALTLLLSGVAASFDAEVERTLDALDVDTWVVAPDAAGPFFGATPMSQDVVAVVAAQPGVERASPVAFFTATVDAGDGATPTTLIGIEPDGVGAPRPQHGDGLRNPGEVIADTSLGFSVGDVLDYAGNQFDVVGTVSGSTLLGGSPNVFLSIAELQRLAFEGAPVIMSVAVEGTPGAAPPDLALMTNDDAKADLLRPLEPAKQTISLISILLWVVTGCIIGSVIYLSALERIRDFAVLKAIGVTTSWIMGGLVLQAIVLSLVASLFAIGVATALAPAMSVPVELARRLLLLVPVIALIVSLLGSFVGVRRAIKIDPALAFG
jgi:putative ABC transport system permease protein